MKLTLEEIKKKYPSINVNDRGGSDSFQEGVEIIERDPVTVVLKHPTKDSYLIAKWKKSAWNGFITGGIEEGDTLEETVRKEICEEAGYKNVGKIIPTTHVAHGLFFHVIKGVNRLAHYHLVAAKLEDLEQDETSAEEQAIADFVWVPGDKVRKTLTEVDMKALWDAYKCLGKDVLK